MKERKQCPDAMGRLRRSVERMLKLIELDAPTVLIASEAMLIHKSAWVVCGTDMGDEMAEWAIATCRQSHGYCQHCNSTVSPMRTHNPICEQCDARLNEECGEEGIE